MLSREASIISDGSQVLPEIPEPIAKAPPELRIAPFLSDQQRALLRKSNLCAKLSDEQAAFFFEHVERVRLDPFTGQIRPDIRKTTNEEGVKVPTLLVITTLQGLRGIGERTNLLDGEDPVEWCDASGVWSQQWLASEPPLAARAMVYRKDRSRPQVIVCRWDAYCQKVYDRHGNEMPNPFWKKMGPHMLGKCALAGAYRALFPNQCSALYITEELGEELDPESEVAIEAEMQRRATAEEQHWQAQRAKGILPVNEQPPPPEKNGGKKKKPAAQVPEPVLAHPIPEPKPEPKAEPKPAIMPTIAIGESPPAWFSFPITRIRIFLGKTIGGLTPSEVRALRVNWMSKVDGAWASVDEDIKAHYAALMQRIEHDEALDQLAAAAAKEMGEDAKRQALDEQLSSDMQLPFATS